MKAEIFILCILPNFCSAQFKNPIYPVTASWFKDRFSMKDWYETLTNFTKIGGDTVLLRAPSVVAVQKQTFDNDPDFVSCVSSTGVKCSDEAIDDMKKLGLLISRLAIYKYEENYSDIIMLCSNYDKKIVNSRTYYRIVLPVQPTNDPCDLPRGSSVVVLFTSFAGVDPHELLLKVAAPKNVSVYFGLPGAITVDSKIDNTTIYAYAAWTQRVLLDQTNRYEEILISNKQLNTNKATQTFNAFKGYYSSDQVSLAVVNNTIYQEIYTVNRALTKIFNKRLVISTNIDLRKSSNSSVTDHAKMFEDIVSISLADAVIIQEGRGLGNAAYYWSTQLNSSIFAVDEKLYEILHGLDPTLPESTTFDDVYVGNIHQVFEALGQSKETLDSSGVHFDMWLGIDAFENLKDDVCSPADKYGSGNPRLLDRTTKSRMDRAITAGGAVVQKVVAFAWDPDFVCPTNHSRNTLAEDIDSDKVRPIIAKCYFHSSFNRSVVVIGYNLLGETQGFTVEWLDIGNTLHNSYVHGYYFESDYGSEHNLVPSLIYTQLYDAYSIMQLNPKGYVKVKAQGSYHECVFTYDYTNENE